MPSVLTFLPQSLSFWGPVHIPFVAHLGAEPVGSYAFDKGLEEAILRNLKSLPVNSHRRVAKAQDSMLWIPLVDLLLEHMRQQASGAAHTALSE